MNWKKVRDIQAAMLIVIMSLLVGCQDGGDDSGSVEPTVNDIPGRVILVGPNSNGGPLPTYQWNAIADAEEFYIVVEDQQGVAIEEIYSVQDLECVFDPSKSNQICELNSEVEIFQGNAVFWVQARNHLGEGQWSEPMQFSVNVTEGDVPPAQVELISPNSDTNELPTFVWRTVEFADSYELYVEDQSGVAIEEEYAAADLGCEFDPDIVDQTCSVVASVALVQGNAKFYVRARNYVDFGAYSEHMNFSVNLSGSGVSAPSVPTLVSPNANVTGVVTFTWNAVSADQYLLYVEDQGGLAHEQWYSASDLGCVGVGQLCSASPLVSYVKGAARYWVMASNQYGDSPWSNPMNFTYDLQAGESAPSRINLVGPVGDVGSTPNFVWYVDQYAENYLVWIQDANGAIFEQSYTPAELGCVYDSQIVDQTCTLPSPLTFPVGDSIWYVQASNSLGTSPWSAAMYFTVQ